MTTHSGDQQSNRVGYFWKLWQWFEERFVQEIPEEMAACLDCRKRDCQPCDIYNQQGHEVKQSLPTTER